MSVHEILLGSLIEPAPLERAGRRNLPILSMTMREGLVDQAAKFKKRVASTDTSEYKIVRKNHLVVGFPIDEGVVSFQDIYDEAIVSPAYDIWRLRSDVEIEPAYLERYLRSPRALSYYRIKLRGTTARRRTLPDDIFLKLSVPAPPLAAQHRVAEILDKADALLAKRRVALTEMDTLIQSIFVDMFGDPATNPKAWPRKALREIFDIARGGSPRPIDDFITDSADGINWIMIGDASEGSKYITRTKRRIRPEGARHSRAVKPGDFLLTNSMSFGKPYIMRTSGCIHDGWLVLSPRKDDVDPDYFYTLLGSRAVFAEFARRAPGATVKNLNIDLVRGVSVPVAPIARQKEYGRVVGVVERAREPFEDSLAQLDALLASLQGRAFRGEL